MLVGGTVVLVAFLETSQDLSDVNQKTLVKIKCSKERQTDSASKTCDISEIQNSPAFEASDYVIDLEQRTLLLSGPRFQGFSVSAVDLEFVREFREPKSIRTLSGATWRLYAERLSRGSANVEVIVGYVEDANWLIEATPANERIDRVLRRDAKRIAEGVSTSDDHVDVGRINSRLDGWQVINSRDGTIIRADGDLPMQLAAHQKVNLPKLVWEKGRLLVVQSDTKGELVAVSLGTVVSLWFLGATVICTFLVVSVVVFWISFVRFRRYFLVMGRHVMTLAEALKTGEDRRVEFKRDARDRDSLLRAIAAFANTNDGTIFVGVSDAAEIVGLDSATPRDKFVTGLQNAVRDRIRPSPVLDVSFEEIDGRAIARIFVPRGDQPLYCLDGRPYVRKGPQSVAADGDEVVRTVLEFA